MIYNKQDLNQGDNKMKKKVAVPIIIVLAVISVYSLLFSGYKFLQNRNDLVQRKALYAKACEFIKEDESFSRQYGNVKIVNAADGYRIILTDDRDFIVYCTVGVSSGEEYDVFLKWNGTFSYAAVEKK